MFFAYQGLGIASDTTWEVVVRWLSDIAYELRISAHDILDLVNCSLWGQSWTSYLLQILWTNYRPGFNAPCANGCGICSIFL